MILVVGATGNLGGAIARALLDRGETIRILVRKGSSYGDLVGAGAEAVLGDLKDPESLRAACEGVDTVITTANSVARGGDDTIESVDLKGSKHLIDAAREGGVKHFIFTSALGASTEHFVPFLQAKGAAEAHLKDSGMTWTILQPNFYMEIWVPTMVGGPALSGRPVTLVGEGKRLHSMVTMRDVVGYAVAAISNEAAHNETLVIGGPEALSWWDVISSFEKELGREVPAETVPLGTPLPGFPEAMTEVVQGLEMYDSPIEMDELSRTFEVTPTPLADFVHEFVSDGAQSAPKS